MLTDIAIKRVIPTSRRQEIPDGKTSGLYLVVQPSGAKSWAYRYRFAGISRKVTFGAYPSIDLATARKRALQASGEVAGGKDPAADKKISRATAHAIATADDDQIARVVALFVERHAKPNTRDWRETERMLAKEVVGRWRGRRLSAITRANVRDMIDQIRERGAPVRANRVFAQFRKLCNWAVMRELIEKSPCAGEFDLSREIKRDRVLSDEELRLVWRAFEKVGWPFGPIGRILLLTGARRNEVCAMTWAEIDLAGRLWTLPAARAKNGRVHEIPLSAAAMTELKTLPRVEGRKGFVFSTTGQTPVSGFSRAKQAVDNAALELRRVDAEAAGFDAKSMRPLEHWTLHDLRRTVATNLQKLGVRLEVTESILNHVSGSRAGVVGVYQRHTYAQEKRSALDAWARRLDGIVSGSEGSNVVELSAGRA